MEKESVPRRLCSEIQLFDLCAREVCEFRDGRYCTNGELLAKFEAISEEEPADDRYAAEDYDEDEGEEGLGYDEAFGGGYGEEESEEEEE